MTEFKPITASETSIITRDSKKGVFVQDDVLSSDIDLAAQMDRIMRNDDIVEALFVYVRELKALSSPNIRVDDVIKKLRTDIIADYPSDVRFA